jgi:hypothetical protein
MLTGGAPSCQLNHNTMCPLLRQHHITQCDMRMRIFDIIVEPVVSYGAHI